ncbi:MAG: Rossmann-like and DUF2520 domain-containing protein [Bacteroidota bacterium]
MIQENQYFEFSRDHGNKEMIPVFLFSGREYFSGLVKIASFRYFWHVENRYRPRIFIAGAGRVASRLARELASRGFTIMGVSSRNGTSAIKVVTETGGQAYSAKDDLPSGADLYILAVPDDRIPELIEKLKGSGATVVHTAGSVGMEVFKGFVDHFGVFYPLQTFTAGRETDFREIPLLIEYSDPVAGKVIRSVAETLSESVIEADTATRARIHLAAVFASNFTNHMVTIGKQLLDAEGLDRKLLDPLLKETFRKLEEMSPEQAQTGPAARGDQGTMERQQLLLETYPDWKNLYIFISQNIADIKARLNRKKDTE